MKKISMLVATNLLVSMLARCQKVKEVVDEFDQRTLGVSYASSGIHSY